MTDDALNEERRSKILSYSAGGPSRWDHFAPDFRFRMIGTTPVSGEVTGSAAVAERIAPFASRLAAIHATVDAVIGEGDTFVRLARGEGVTVDGRPYRNEYATLFRFEGDKIVECVEYLDTALIERVVRGEV